MSKSKVTTKGQITIPQHLRQSLDIQPGDEVEFFEEGVVIRIRKVRPDNPFARWRGYLTHLEGQDIDQFIEEMRGR